MKPEHGIVKLALIIDQLEDSARQMMRASMNAQEQGDKEGARREWCIAVREYEWAAMMWETIGISERAERCRDQARAARAGEICNCKETYPQLERGMIHHGAGCLIRRASR